MAAIPLKYAKEDCEHGRKESMEICVCLILGFEALIFIRVMHVSGPLPAKWLLLGILRKIMAVEDNVMDEDKKTRLLVLQLLAILYIVLLFLTVPLVKSFIHENGWMLYVAYIILSIGTLLAPIVKRRAHLSLMTAFTVAQSYIVGGVLCFYLSYSETFVVLALGLTSNVILSLFLFAHYTKRDFSFMKYWLVAGLNVLALLTIDGVLQIAMQSYGVELLLVFGGAIHFSLYLIIDTHQMITNLSPEEYFCRQVGHYVVFRVQAIINACICVYYIFMILIAQFYLQE